MRTATLLRLATTGGRQDVLRIATTALGTAAGTLALLCALTVVAIGPGEGRYTSNLLNEQDLHTGVVITFVLLGIPLLAFVGQCSRIGAPARDRRLASLRMSGASPGDVTRIAAAESGVAAAGGAVAGLAIYVAGRELLDDPSTVGAQVVRSLPTDVMPPWWALLVVVAGLPAAAALFSAIALRRVALTPFGILREQRDVPPRVLPLALLVLGGGGMAAFSAIVAVAHLDRRPVILGGAIFALLFLLAASGLILGTASFAAVFGRLLAPRVRRPSLLIASRRMIALPLSASRTSSAILLAVLIGALVAGLRTNILLATNHSETFYASTFDLIDLAIAVALAIAAAGLLVNAAEGIVGRRRTYAALVAAGTPRPVLARAALAETLLPLIPGVILAAAMGILAARGVFGTRVERLDTQVVDGVRVNVASRMVDVPVPWEQLGILVGGSLAVIFVTTAIALAFLRSASDPTELRTAA
ncbi:MAG: FtsX-like permease family protein [Solirubrobacteraceae bacterium]